MELREPFHLSRSYNPREDALNAVVSLHQSGGVDRMTISAVAKHLGVAKSSVHASHGGLAGFYESLVVAFGYRWAEWVSEARGQTIPVRLPESDCDKLGVLTWQSLRTVAAAEARAGRPEAWKAARHVWTREKYFLINEMSGAEGERPDAQTLATLMALADGIRLRMVDPTHPLEAAAARQMLASAWPGERSLGSPKTFAWPPTDERS